VAGARWRRGRQAGDAAECRHGAQSWTRGAVVIYFFKKNYGGADIGADKKVS
jgi:hypothetical protein